MTDAYVHPLKMAPGTTLVELRAAAPNKIWNRTPASNRRLRGGVFPKDPHVSPMRRDVAMPPAFDATRNAVPLGGAPNVAPGHCPCGQPLHYRSPLVRQLIEGLISVTGLETIVVHTQHTSWRVSRHFIALHSFNRATLPAQARKYGFEQVPRA